MKRFTKLLFLLVLVSLRVEGAISFCPPPPTINPHPVNKTICDASASGGGSANFTVGPTGAGISYQWQVNNGSWTTIGGATSPTLSITGAKYSTMNGYQYRCIVTDGSGSSTSNAATLTILSPPIINVQPQDTVRVCDGADFSVNVGATGSGLTYQWYRSKGNGFVAMVDSGEYTGTKTPTLNVEKVKNINGGGTFRVYKVLVSSGGCSVSSRNVFLIIYAPVIITAHPTDQVICVNNSTSFSIAASGSGLMYQWEVDKGAGFSSVSGGVYSNATSVTLNITGATSLMSGYKYRCKVVSDTCGIFFSNIATLTVDVAPNIHSQPSNIIVCNGDNAIFKVGATGTNLNYQWYLNVSATIPVLESGMGPFYSGTTTPDLNLTGVSDLPPITGTYKSFRCRVSNMGCGAVLSSFVGLSILPNVVADISITSTPSPANICSGGSVTFKSTVTNGGSSTLYQWQNKTVNIPGETNSTFTSSSLQDGDVITCVITSNAACVSGSPKTSNQIIVTVTGSLVASVTITSSPTAVCANSTVCFTANPVNGGTQPAYQWRKGMPLGSIIPSETNSVYCAPFNANTIIFCYMTSNAGSCVTGSPAQSNLINVTMVSNLTASVTISATNTSICSGDLVCFTAAPVNEGANPKYQWRDNGGTISGATNKTYCSATIANSHYIQCVLTSNDPCVSIVNVISPQIDMVVSTKLTPQVTISASATTICPNTNVNFTAVPVNGGAATYKWYVNGVPDISSTSAVFNSASLKQGEVVECEMTSTVSCLNGPSVVNSNQIQMTVTAALQASVSITSSAATICPNGSVTFSALPVNGGVPSYQWKKDGSPIGGATKPTYTFQSPVGGEVITCVMTSTAACVSGSPYTSNPITIIVVPNLPVSVTITASATTICPGTVVDFSAIPVNEGIGATYQWYKNTFPFSAATNQTYSTGALANNDVIYCIMKNTDLGVCLSGSPAKSNDITIKIVTNLVPSVSITSTNTTICTGTQVCFTATTVYGGNLPKYEWRKNGAPIAAETNQTYCYSSFNNNDYVECFIRSNDPCVTPTTALSNKITLNVSSSITASVSITANPNGSVCTNTPVIFTATPGAGINSPTYTWKIDGATQGTTGSVLAITKSTGTYTVTCEVNSSTSPCVTGFPAIASKILTVTVAPTADVTISPGSQSICANACVTFNATAINGGGNPLYQWYKNASIIPAETKANYTVCALLNADEITCMMTSSLTCVTGSPATSTKSIISIISNAAAKVTITSDVTQVCPGGIVNFTATESNGGSPPTFDWKKTGGFLLASTTNYTYSQIFTTGTTVTCVMTSNPNAGACVTGSPALSTNSIVITVVADKVPSVNISASKIAICGGETVCFTASAVNGGPSPKYQWRYKGGIISAATDSIYCRSSFTNNDDVQGGINSNDPCATTTGLVLSNKIFMQVTASATPAVTITNTPGSTLCEGSVISYTATATPAGTTFDYQWKDGTGANIGSATANPIFDAGVLPPGPHTIYCEVTVTGVTNCLTSQTAQSTTKSLTITASKPASIVISESVNNVCPGTSITFSSVVNNEGTAPKYQWVNSFGIIPGATKPTYTATFSADDVITCIMTSNLPLTQCLTGSPATSNVINITVIPNVTAKVDITASKTSICAGETVYFTATPTSGGTPLYQWFKGAVPIGAATDATYSSATLANNDIITVKMTSNAQCVLNSPATSNAINFNVTISPPASVTISSPNISVCEGTAINFTAVPVNEGTSPTYEWIKNGNTVLLSASTNSTFSSASLTTADVITCVMTSSLTCVIGSPDTSNGITVTVTPNVVASVQITADDSTICPNTNVNFTASIQNGGLLPSLQWLLNGDDITGAINSTFNKADFNNGDTVSCILISNAQCVTGSPDTSDIIIITVKPNVTASISISNPPASICSGTKIDFTATATYGGPNPKYQWQINGVDEPGETNVTFSRNNLKHLDKISCVLTSNEECVIGSPDTSAQITVTIIQSVTPSVTISTNTVFPVCDGTMVCFTATPVNGGTPVYQWRIGGVIQPNTNDSIFCRSNLKDKEVVDVRMTSSAQCASPSSVLSTNKITADIDPILQASVSITPSMMSICAGNNASFTALPVNEGSNPTYQWLVDGSAAPGGTNSNIYSSITLQNGEVVTVVMTSSEACVSGSPANSSNSVIMDVKPYVDASVTITGAPNPVCKGSAINFTATPMNGGVTPSYQWILNTSTPIAGATKSTFSSTTLNNNDVIEVIMTSDLLCVNNSPASSNQIPVTVTQTNPVSVTINASINNICAGTQVCFTATPVNEGSNPTYEWRIGNGPAPGGTNSPTYCNSNLSNNQVVTVRMTSNINCPSPISGIVTSTGITMKVTANVIPLVTITSSPAVICPNTTVTFTANPTNGGTVPPPTYEWFYKGVAVANSNSPTYSKSGLITLDKVTVRMTSGVTCVTKPTASDSVTMTVTPNVNAGVSVSASSLSVCQGTPITFTAAPVNGGSPTYVWSDGTTTTGKDTIIRTLAPGMYSISVTMTSTANCVLNSPANSNTVNVTVTPTTNVSVSITASSTDICKGTNVDFTATPVAPGGAPVYEWFIGNNSVGSGSTFSTASLNDKEVVTVKLTSNAVCPAPVPAVSNAINMKVTDYVDASVVISTPLLTVCDKASVDFTATPTNGGAPVYDWKINGSSVGTGPVFTTIDLVDGDVVSCMMTSDLKCVNVNPVPSNDITMKVNQYVPVSVSITNSKNNICDGDQVDFTAIPVNEGGTPSYQWQSDYFNIPGATGLTYSSATLKNGEVISFVLTSSIQCVTGSPATSNEVTMIVNPIVAASVSITASSNNVCAGAIVDFTATPIYGGNGPTYQWILNGGIIPAETGATFRSANLPNDANVKCIMTSDQICVTGSPATSNVVIIKINQNTVPGITISTPDTDVCSTKPVDFTSVIVNGGSSPGYQWMINSSNVSGETNSTFSSNSFANGDEVTCVLASNAYCATTPTTVSNILTLTVNPNPVITLAAEELISCYGAPVTLEASGADSYLWTPGDFLSCASCPSTFASPLNPATYVVTGTIGNCSSSDTVSISIKCDQIFIPTGFTPNNDKVNDIFKVEAPQIYNFEMKVFNRWGELMFESHDQNFGWDGTYKTNPMPIGVYIWIISGTDYYGNKIIRNGRAGVIGGDVTLIR